MKFFVPQTQRQNYEKAYRTIVDLVKKQMRMPVTERRIYSLRYVQDKKTWVAAVGQPEPQEGRYEILAILEAKPHVVYTRTKNGGEGVTILINNDDITEVVDFD